MEHNEDKEVGIIVKKVNRKAPKQVSFRLTEAEFWKLVRNAENSNASSISDYAKKIVLKDCRRESLTPKMAKEDSLAIVKELNKIGGNINQIAAWMNRNDRVPLEQEEVLIRDIDELKKEFANIWQRLS